MHLKTLKFVELIRLPAMPRNLYLPIVCMILALLYNTKNKILMCYTWDINKDLGT